MGIRIVKVGLDVVQQAHDQARQKGIDVQGLSVWDILEKGFGPIDPERLYEVVETTWLEGDREYRVVLGSEGYEEEGEAVLLFDRNPSKGYKHEWSGVTRVKWTSEPKAEVDSPYSPLCTFAYEVRGEILSGVKDGLACPLVWPARADQHVLIREEVDEGCAVQSALLCPEGCKDHREFERATGSLEPFGNTIRITAMPQAFTEGSLLKAYYHMVPHEQ